MKNMSLYGLGLLTVMILLGCNETQLNEASESQTSTTVSTHKTLEDKSVNAGLSTNTEVSDVAEQVQQTETTRDPSQSPSHSVESVSSTSISHSNSSNDASVNTSNSTSSSNAKSGCQVYNPITGGCED